MSIHDLDEESAEVIFNKYVVYLHPGLKIWALRIRRLNGARHALYAVEAWFPGPGIS